MTTRFHKLRALKDSDLAMPHTIDDIRWRKVVDSHGDDLGQIDELLLDEAQRKVRFLRVADGGLLGIGTTKVLIPAEAVGKVTHDVVYLAQPRAKIAAAPGYDPELVDEAYYASLFDYYGY